MAADQDDTKRPRASSTAEVIFAGDLPAATLSRMVKDGRLRRLARGIYTSRVSEAEEAVVRRNAWAIAAHLFPNGVIADRSALPGFEVAGTLFLAHEGPSRDVQLPGLLIRARSGHGSLPGDIRLGQYSLTLSSPARALVENVAVSRSRGGRPARTVGVGGIEEAILSLSRQEGRSYLEHLKGEVTTVGKALDLEAAAAEVGRITDAVIDRTPTFRAVSRQLRSYLKGVPFDPARNTLFDVLHDELVKRAPASRPVSALGELPFFEAYFSNFIEGTEFELEEARKIVLAGWQPAGRPEDAHDVRCTFTIVNDDDEMRRTPTTSDELVAMLRERHRVLMASRPDKRPGRFKERNNRAGSTHFVDHRLVIGTLREGFDRFAALSDPFQRACFVMFLISEVHPFDDGNGRIARVFMNAELAHVGQQRIVIPPIYRDDYLSALRALSQNREPQPLEKMLGFAQTYAARIDWSDYDSVCTVLEQTHALLVPDEADRRGLRLRLP